MVNKLVEKDEPSSVLFSIEAYITLCDIHESVKGRQSAIARLKRVMDQLERFYATIPPGTATLEQETDLWRAWSDLRCLSADIGQFDLANFWMKALSRYQNVGDETTLRFQFALQYAVLTDVKVGQGRIEEALNLIWRSFVFCHAKIGPDHLETGRVNTQEYLLFMLRKTLDLLFTSMLKCYKLCRRSSRRIICWYRRVNVGLVQ